MSLTHFCIEREGLHWSHCTDRSVGGLAGTRADFGQRGLGAERITQATGYRVRARELATELGWSPERPQAGLADTR